MSDPQVSANASEPIFARAIACLAILIGAVAVAAHLWTAYRHESEHAMVLTSAMSDAIAHQVKGTFRGIEGLLDEAASAVRSGQWQTPAYRQRMAGRMLNYPEVRWVGRVTAAGILLPDTEPGIGIAPPGLNVADRDYFIHLNCDQPRLRVGQPVVGRATGERSIHLALPVTGGNGASAKGGCDGLVVAAVNPDSMANLLAEVMLDSAGGTSLIRSDGLMVARAPNHVAAYGQDLSKSLLFTDYLSKNPNGQGRFVSEADGNDKFLSYRSIKEYGLVVTAGVSRSRALDGWYGMAALEAAVFVMFALGIYMWARSTDQRHKVMLRYQEGLEKAVDERTNLLSQSKAVAEERAASLERVNVKLTHLARVTAHHLQEPLRPIVSFSQLARRQLIEAGGGGEAAAEMDEHLGFVERAGRHLKLVLSDFHRYTALLTRAPKTGRCDLQVVLERVRTQLAVPIAESGAVLEIGSLPKVTADAELMEQVLLELLSNALRYRHPERPLLIDIVGGLDQDYWWLKIRDNGRGLPQVGRQHLFEAFCRLNPDDPSAIGLGLAVCREVAEMHGGDIHAESLAEGTAFILRVPLDTRAEQLMV